ncbi:MAG: hypothetical protein JJU06_15515 [Ectothiorhodospiraceae bacterium]|nr:hypothetical protein [Ectothiorhodospiraceae bacterium]
MAASIVLLAGCAPVTQTVVMVPATDGHVLDSTSGAAVTGVELTVLHLPAVEDVEPVYTDSAGFYAHPIVVETRTTWRLATVGGTYRTDFLLRARHPDYADGFARVGYVFPGQTTASGVPILLFRESAPLPEALDGCDLGPEHRYAYTLATRLEALSGQAWFRAYVEEDVSRLDHLRESISLSLGTAARRCGHPDVLTKPYERILDQMVDR